MFYYNLFIICSIEFVVCSYGLWCVEQDEDAVGSGSLFISHHQLSL